MAEKEELEKLRQEVAELRETLAGRERAPSRGRFPWDEAEAAELRGPRGIGLEPTPPHLYLAQGQRAIHQELATISEKLDTIISTLKK